MTCTIAASGWKWSPKTFLANDDPHSPRWTTDLSEAFQFAPLSKAHEVALILGRIHKYPRGVFLEIESAFHPLTKHDAQ